MHKPNLNKDQFLEELYKSSSRQEVLAKIEIEKNNTESVLDLPEYFPTAKLHLEIINEISFFMSHKTFKTKRDDNLNEWIAKISNKFGE